MKSGRFGILSAGVLIVGALVLMVFRRSVAGEAVYPVERLVTSVRRSVGRVATGLFAGAENARLRREVALLSPQRVDMERLRMENARLRKALGYGSRHPGEWLPACVLSSGGGASAVSRLIRVDKGSLAGVRKGAVAVVPEGLVGRVTGVTPHTAEIALLTDPSVRVACAVGAGSEKVHGILSGGEADGLLIRYLGGAERLSTPSRVVTSGLGGVFPPDLEIGTLLFVTNGVRGAEGEVRPSVDYSTLEDVFIRRDQ